MASAGEMTVEIKVKLPNVRTNGDLVAVETKRDGRWFLVNEARWLTEGELADYEPLTEE